MASCNDTVRGSTVCLTMRNEAVKVWKFGKVQMPQNAWILLKIFSQLYKSTTQLSSSEELAKNCIYKTNHLADEEKYASNIFLIHI